MADPHAILCVPTEAGAPLLAEGPCGASPPHVHRYACSRGHTTAWQQRRVTNPHCDAHVEDRPFSQGPGKCFDYGARTDALPLRWDGAPVPEGVFRAWHAWGPDEDPESEAAFEATGWTTYDVLAEAMDGAAAAEWLAHSLERQGLCRVVLLDLVDGRLQERAQ